MRVGILGLQHESNTFYPEPTALQNFRDTILVRGEDVRRKYEGAHHEVGGFLEGLAHEGIEAVPLMMAFALPSGAVLDETRDELWRIACEELQNAGQLDGLLLAPHGAAVSVSHPDMDGWWLSRLREIVGPDFPLIAVIDPHANFSAQMASCCDAVIAYRENPHVDQKQRGLEAAALMARRLRGEIKPVVAASFPDIAINIERQLTWAEPMLSVIAELEKIRAREGVLSASVIMGYPYADVHEMGSSFVVVTDDDPALAQSLADQLSAWLTQNRDLFLGVLTAPEDAVRDAVNRPAPVALLDMGDNLGGGAPADSTVLAHLCHRLEPHRRTFICLFDPESAAQADTAGVGGKLTLRMGGKCRTSPAPPLECEVTVQSLHDGRYGEDQPRHGGLKDFDMGRTAIVTTESALTVMLSSRAVLPASVNQMLSCGLDPTEFDLIILKGAHLPVAAYKDVCGTMIRVNTPGVTTADMKALSYKNRRKPLFPFEEKP